jgi:hypothetical protein
MLVRLFRFNLYLLVVALLVFGSGCASEQHKKKRAAATLSLHLEVSRFETHGTQTISVPREHPIQLTVLMECFLTEADVVEAKLIENPGGFAISMRFDTRGKWLLEQYSAPNVGRHLAIRVQYGDKLEQERWLAAPTLLHRISDGIITFTPDCTREEAERIVLGLNNVAKKVHDKSEF